MARRGQCHCSGAPAPSEASLSLVRCDTVGVEGKGRGVGGAVGGEVERGGMARGKCRSVCQGAGPKARVCPSALLSGGMQAGPADQI